MPVSKPYYWNVSDHDMICVSCERTEICDSGRVQRYAVLLTILSMPAHLRWNLTLLTQIVSGMEPDLTLHSMFERCK